MNRADRFTCTTYVFENDRTKGPLKWLASWFLFQFIFRSEICSKLFGLQITAFSHGDGVEFEQAVRGFTDEGTIDAWEELQEYVAKGDEGWKP